MFLMKFEAKFNLMLNTAFDFISIVTNLYADSIYISLYCQHNKMFSLSVIKKIIVYMQ